MFVITAAHSSERESDMDRAQWIAERKQGIGASDCSSILGLNPYKTNVQLWEEKTGRYTPEDIGNKPVVRYGVEAEQHLRELFKLDYPQYQVNYEEFKLYRDSQYPFLFATLDGELIDKETGEAGILEIKTTNILQSMQKESWNDRIPDNYYLQVLHQMMVTGYSFVILKAHLKTDWSGNLLITTKHYIIRREDVQADIDLLQAKEIEFWNEYVVKDKRPGLILPTI